LNVIHATIILSTLNPVTAYHTYLNFMSALFIFRSDSRAHLNDSAAATDVASPIAAAILGLMPGTAVVFVEDASSCGSDDSGSPAASAASETFFGTMLRSLLLRIAI
jgi:hypothetical protein